MAATRAELRPLAEETAEVVPYLQVFYLFQVMTAARRAETMGLPWAHIDFEAGTAYLPETKNGRPRKLALREDLLEQLKLFPRDTDRVFAVGLDYVIGSWSKACRIAGIDDLHIHDGRHEALSRLAESGKFTLPELQVFSGHRDLRMLMRYAHLCSSRLARKLNECFKDDKKVRIHRGRRFLSKAAELPIGSLTADTEEAPRDEVLPAASATSEARPIPAPRGAAQQAQAVHVGTAARATNKPDEAKAASAAVIAFPASRIVGTFGQEDTTDKQRHTAAAQAPSAG